MKKLKKFSKKLFTSQAGQGTAEYVLLIAIVLGLLIAFKDPIKNAMQKKIGEVSDGIGNFSTQ